MPGRSGAGETITTVGFDDAAVGAECTDPLEERGGADANLGSQFGERNRLVGTGEDGRDALVERTGRRRHRLAAIGDFQSEGVAALCQLDGQRLRRRRRAMFDRQSDLITVAAQVEIAVAPGVELDEPRSACPARTPPPPFLA